MDLVGDIGGVLEVFISIFGIILTPISEYVFSNTMISSLFLAKTRDQSIFQNKQSQRKDFYHI